MDSTFTIFQTDCSSLAQCSGEGDHWNRNLIISNMHEMLTIALIIIPTTAKCARLLARMENQENDKNDTNCYSH